MAKKKRGLGRGLDALIGEVSAKGQPEPTGETDLAAGSENLKELPIEFLKPGKYQPRKDMREEALEELTASIKAQGLMQPIVVRPVGPNQYEIIAGERRWRASQMAQLDKIPALIKDVPDEAAIAMALIENLQREDLNPMEEAEALHRLSVEFDLSHQQVADAVGKSRTAVSNLLRLINLGLATRRLLENGDIEMGHARAMLSLPEDQQADLARQVVAKGLSVRQTEAAVKKVIKGEKLENKKTTTTTNTDVRRLETELSEKLCAHVQIKHGEKGKGKLVVSYNSIDELEGILEHIK